MKIPPTIRNKAVLNEYIFNIFNSVVAVSNRFFLYNLQMIKTQTSVIMGISSSCGLVRPFPPGEEKQPLNPGTTGTDNGGESNIIYIT